ncbi:MAG: PH domain-containing protein [Dongiaceae bacterium]
MSYVRRVLEPDEAILYATTVHWLIYGPAILLLAAAIGSAVLAGGVADEARGILLIAAVLLAVLALASWLPAALRRASTELVVTDRRVIYKSGLFSRHTIEMNRTKVESVDVDQSVLGRLLGYGTVTVHGTGGTLEPIRSVARPLTFRSHITAA